MIALEEVVQEIGKNLTTLPDSELQRWRMALKGDLSVTLINSDDVSNTHIKIKVALIISSVSVLRSTLGKNLVLLTVRYDYQPEKLANALIPDYGLRSSKGSIASNVENFSRSISMMNLYGTTLLQLFSPRHLID